MGLSELQAVVVVPARDEEAHIALCLAALAAQAVPRAAFAVILVLDACRDATAAEAARAARALGLELELIDGPGAGAGAARRAGMDAAAACLRAAGRPRGLIACTDADSRPAPDWLARQLALVAGGAHAIGGVIELEEAEAALLSPAVLARRAAAAERRLAAVRVAAPGAEHHHFGGASLAVTAEAYERVGGLEPLTALEDEAFAARLAAHRIPITRSGSVRVRTSARAAGRARRGLAVDLAVAEWLARRRHRAEDFDRGALRAAKGETTVAVVLPAKEVAATVGAVLDTTVAPLLAAGLLDDVLVIDAGSADGTAARAAAAGARVVQEDAILPEHGPARGKGDAMWRGVHATDADVVCFLDTDTADPHPRHLEGLLGPLLIDPEVGFVKGAFERPLRTAAGDLPHEGGRVTELMARPLLNLHVPLLAGFAQPLAGEFAGRRELFEAIPFPCGYGVEIATLIDALGVCGLDGLAEVALGTRQNRHQPLRALGEMAYAVLAAVEARVDDAGGSARGVARGHYLRPWEDGVVVTVPVGERPPLASLRAPLAGSGSAAG